MFISGLHLTIASVAMTCAINTEALGIQMVNRYIQMATMDRLVKSMNQAAFRVKEWTNSIRNTTNIPADRSLVVPQPKDGMFVVFLIEFVHSLTLKAA
jgi:hypothetical protein